MGPENGARVWILELSILRDVIVWWKTRVGVEAVGKKYWKET